MSAMIEVLVIVALTLANGLFAGAEVAMLAVRRTRLAELADEGSSRARTALGLRSEPERLLATIQIGITAIGVGAAAFGGARVAGRLAAGLHRYGLDEDTAASVALAAVVVFVTYLSIVLGELVPKSLALRGAERFVLAAALPLRLFAWLARPLVWILTLSSNVLLRAFRDETTFTEARLSPDELQQLVEEAATAGTLPPKAGDIAARALDFAHLDVKSVMTPRGDVVTLDRESLRDELLEALAAKPHDRYPIVDGDLDQPVGYVVVRDIARRLADPDADLAPAVNPPVFVTSSMKAVDALAEMQRTGMQLMMVVDELGAVIGLVTLEDLVEELVGDILAEKERPDPAVERAADGTARVRGRVAVHEVNRALGLELPEGPGWTTVGGLVTSLAGRIPKPGTTLDVNGVKIEVLEATQRRVISLRLHPPHGQEA